MSSMCFPQFRMSRAPPRFPPPVLHESPQTLGAPCGMLAYLAAMLLSRRSVKSASLPGPAAPKAGPIRSASPRPGSGGPTTPEAVCPTPCDVGMACGGERAGAPGCAYVARLYGHVGAADDARQRAEALFNDTGLLPWVRTNRWHQDHAQSVHRATAHLARCAKLPAQRLLEHTQLTDKLLGCRLAPGACSACWPNNLSRHGLQLRSAASVRSALPTWTVLCVLAVCAVLGIAAETCCGFRPAHEDRSEMNGLPRGRLSACDRMAHYWTRGRGLTQPVVSLKLCSARKRLEHAQCDVHANYCSERFAGAQLSSCLPSICSGSPRLRRTCLRRPKPSASCAGTRNFRDSTRRS